MLKKSQKDYRAWIKEAKRLFREFVHNLELKCRRDGKNLEKLELIRTYAVEQKTSSMKHQTV
ncbi:MAG: Transposase, putative [Methanothrix harundinacea]|jgi:hypothetical protein|uniref:Transposase, putative n=1 Tax=Methanothrix harundinacea TaxID=301375 RepID=A0A117LF09_9EURY|nr:MAG: Transposase, putative [Methanothrix harundinacea]